MPYHTYHMLQHAASAVQHTVHPGFFFQASPIAGCTPLVCLTPGVCSYCHCVKALGCCEKGVRFMIEGRKRATHVWVQSCPCSSGGMSQGARMHNVLRCDVHEGVVPVATPCLSFAACWETTACGLVCGIWMLAAVAPLQPSAAHHAHPGLVGLCCGMFGCPCTTWAADFLPYVGELIA